MRRLYFLVPDTGIGKKVVDELLLATSRAGAGIGVYMGGMVGLNVGSTRLKAFQEAIERGELLVIADLPAGRVDEISERIRKAYPQAELEGTEPRVPAFP